MPPLPTKNADVQYAAFRIAGTPGVTSEKKELVIATARWMWMHLKAAAGTSPAKIEVKSAIIKEIKRATELNGVDNRMTFERLCSVLEAIQTQIRAFDTKAQVAIGVNGVLVGFATAEIAKAAEYGASGIYYRLLFTCMLAGASLCAALIAIGFPAKKHAR